MDLDKVGEELGTEVEGVRNRLSFLAHNPTPGYVALEEREKAGSLQSDEQLHGICCACAVHPEPCQSCRGGVSPNWRGLPSPMTHHFSEQKRCRPLLMRSS